MKTYLTSMALIAFAATAVADGPATNPFFAFDNGVGRGTWTPEQQAETLAELGYDGIGYSGDAELDARLAAFAKHGVKVFNLYVPCYVDREPAYSESLVQAITRLKGTDVLLWLTVQGKAGDDVKAVQAVRAIADLAGAAGLRVALYPHYGFHVATLDDALRVVEAAGRENLGVTFNLCHELRSGNEARFGELLEKAAPHLFVVSINGADHEGDWDRLIQPLGDGAFDVYPVLKKLKAVGYTGPIGLQCYNVKGDMRENLTKSMAAWKALQVRLAAE